MALRDVQMVLDVLDYANSDGLVTEGERSVAPDRAYLWEEVREKFGIDAVYFHGNVPAVYFKALTAPNDDALMDLHRELWNHNRAQLLVAVMPEQVRIYNCFAPPAKKGIGDPDASLLAAVQLATDVMRRDLAPYRRDEVESGRLARDKRFFENDRRVHRQLLENLSRVRSKLIREGLEEAVVNSLIGRSIFVRYLEDRRVLDPSFFAQFAESRSYCDLLQRSSEGTYRLFAFLAQRFNGDMFPVTPEEASSVTIHHLGWLGLFLSGADVGTGQTYFWAYDFEYIPIELISSIYEKFLLKRQAQHGAYYTPPEVVDFVLNSILPWGAVGRSRVLDPACGSGIFLVEAYRRLVERERRTLAEKHLGAGQLTDILVSCIYGVDINEEAVRVAAFSCYLALLDFLEPKEIWSEVRFPTLVGSNLFVNDFFDPIAPFNAQRFDVIVGNPPWQSTANRNDLVIAYLREHGRSVGDNQLALAFLWRAPDLLAPGGEVCLLAPSKAVLFNKSRTSRDFRRAFFAAHDVTAVVDFSLFRRSLFETARAPMVAVFYRVIRGGESRDEFRYFTPHPSPLAESLAGIVVSGDEIRKLSRDEAIDNPDVWKIALLGTGRDLAFIEDLRRRFPSLGTIADREGWAHGQGIQRGAVGGHVAPELAAMWYIPAADLGPFQVSSSVGSRIGTDKFRRTGVVAAFDAPHVLVHKGVLGGGKVAAAYVADRALFTDAILGFAGTAKDARLLKVLCAYLNSSLARYYYFLTSSSWGIERDQIHPNEYLSLPFAIPDDSRISTDQIASFVDEVQRDPGAGAWQDDLDELVFAAYGLTLSERALVLDTIGVTMDMFYHGMRSEAFLAPTVSALSDYAEAFSRTVNSALDASPDVFEATIFQGESPYSLVSFRLVERGADDHPRVRTHAGLNNALAELDSALLQQHSERLYLRRNLTVFDRDAVHVAKPSERRYWTRSAAFNDADDTIAQVMRHAQLV